MNLHRGRIIVIDVRRRFGKIVADEGGPAVFFTELDGDPRFAIDDWRRGQRVEFELHHSHRGPRARNVRPVESARA